MIIFGSYIFEIRIPTEQTLNSLPVVPFSAFPKWHFIMKTQLQNFFLAPTATLWGENDNIYLPKTYLSDNLPEVFREYWQMQYYMGVIWQTH